MRSRIKSNRHSAFVAQGRRCCYCGVLMWLQSPSELPVPLPSARAAKRLRCTAEHLRPRGEGGSDAATNIAAACLHCNNTRHKRRLPPSPAAYTRDVARRVAARRWHPSWVFEVGLIRHY